MYLSIYIYIHIHAAVSNGKHKMKAQEIFLDLFAVCSSSQWKFVVYPFVYEETNRSYPFANGLKELIGLNGLAHFCI
jgi:hypothetical protein